MKLRNAILRFISDLPQRHILSSHYPRDGRALLHHLRTQSNTTLSTPQVNSILADIRTLIDAGIKHDTTASFRELGFIYHRLLSRIPESNAARDSPAIQAMRYTQAVIKGRTDIGQQIMHHYTSRSVDQNDPNAVRDAICEYLDEQANIRRLCSPDRGQDPSPPTPPLTLPDMNLLKAFINQSLLNQARDPRKHAARKPPTRDYKKPPTTPCPHCGGMHWGDRCTSDAAGTFAYQKRHTAKHTHPRYNEPR